MKNVKKTFQKLITLLNKDPSSRRLKVSLHQGVYLTNIIDAVPPQPVKPVVDKIFNINKKSQKSLTIKRLSCDTDNEDIVRKTMFKQDSNLNVSPNPPIFIKNEVRGCIQSFPDKVAISALPRAQTIIKPSISQIKEIKQPKHNNLFDDKQGCSSQITTQNVPTLEARDRESKPGGNYYS